MEETDKVHKEEGKLGANGRSSKGCQAGNLLEVSPFTNSVPCSFLLLHPSSPPPILFPPPPVLLQ